MNIICDKHDAPTIFDEEKGILCFQCHLKKLMEQGLQVEDLILH